MKKLTLITCLICGVGQTMAADNIYDPLKKYDSLLDMATQMAQSPEGNKQVLCEMKGYQGQLAVGYYENRQDGFTKDMTRDIMLSETRQDSLDYILMELAIDKAYAGVSAEGVGKTVFKHCMQQPGSWVDRADMTKQEFQQDQQDVAGWEAARCDDRMEQLSMVDLHKFEGASEKKLRQLITTAVEDKALADKMGNALMRSEQQYHELVQAFEDQCGR